MKGESTLEEKKVSLRFLADQIVNDDVAEIDAIKLIAEMYPTEMSGVLSCKQDTPYHCYDLKTHLAVTANYVSRLYTQTYDDKLMLIVASLLHDIGKPVVMKRKMHDYYGREIDTFYNHAKVSAERAKSILSIDSSFTDKEQQRILFMIKNHDKFMNYKSEEEFASHKWLAKNPWFVKISESNLKRFLDKNDGSIDDWILVTFVAEGDAFAQTTVVRNKYNEVADTLFDKINRLLKIRSILVGLLEK